MSIHISTQVWIGSQARGGELLVLLAIADHANEQRCAWPGIESLAKKTRQSIRHVQRCLKELVKRGELEIVEQAGPYGTNLYKILALPAQVAPSQMSPPPTSTTCRGDIRGSQMSPESSEPSVESTHTLRAVEAGETKKLESGHAEPSEQEVIEHARTYPGDAANGIPAGAIMEIWAKNYWSWRTAKEDWPKGWRQEMFRRFEGEWLDGRAGAHGRPSPKSPHANWKNQPAGEPPMPVKSCRANLSDLMALVK